MIDVPFDARQIAAAVERATSPAFRADLVGLRNPYGDGKAAPRIVDRLLRQPLNAALLQKKFVDLPAEVCLPAVA